MDSSQELNKKTALELLGIEEDYTKYIELVILTSF